MRISYWSSDVCSSDLLQYISDERRMRIELRCPADLPAVPGDADQLGHVFRNLVENAVKYGRPGTPVEVEVRLDPAEARPRQVAVGVRDHGEGIAREHLHRLTERFYRADRARSRDLGEIGRAHV